MYVNVSLSILTIPVKSIDKVFVGITEPVILTVPVGWSSVWTIVKLIVISWVIDVTELSVEAVTMIIDDPL